MFKWAHLINNCRDSLKGKHTYLPYIMMFIYPTSLHSFQRNEKGRVHIAFVITTRNCGEQCLMTKNLVNPYTMKRKRNSAIKKNKLQMNIIKVSTQAQSHQTHNTTNSMVLSRCYSENCKTTTAKIRSVAENKMK